MQREIILTKDGSHTVSIPEMNVTYHSLHGAIQESMHIFIEAGLRQLTTPDPVYIFEMGFGTGLNALLTLIEAEKEKKHIHYTSIELFPMSASEISNLNYCQQLNANDLEPVFKHLHESPWEGRTKISEYFTLQKLNSSLSTLQLLNAPPFNLIYFDAFAPSAQPGLWTKEIFEKLFGLLDHNGILVTYCSKGDVRRAMQAAGFIVEKIPGPPGKREMVRAKRC